MSAWPAEVTVPRRPVPVRQPVEWPARFDIAEWRRGMTDAEFRRLYVQDWPSVAPPLEHLAGTACRCAECRSLESMPAGIPGAVQLRLLG